jgi:hypothetical protein
MAEPWKLSPYDRVSLCFESTLMIVCFKDMTENEENIYSIIKTIDVLEWAYTRGIVKSKDYHVECKKLIHQYLVCVDNIDNFKGLDKFMQVFIYITTK